MSGPTANRRPLGRCKAASAGLFWGGGGGRAVRASCLPKPMGFFCVGSSPASPLRLSHDGVRPRPRLGRVHLARIELATFSV